MDAKRKNKLLKVAIGRLQNDIDKAKDTPTEGHEPQMITAEPEKDTDTFLTGARVDELGPNRDIETDNMENS